MYSRMSSSWYGHLGSHLHFSVHYNGTQQLSTKRDGPCSNKNTIETWFEFAEFVLLPDLHASRMHYIHVVGVCSTVLLPDPLYDSSVFKLVANDFQLSNSVLF